MDGAKTGVTTGEPIPDNVPKGFAWVETDDMCPDREVLSKSGENDPVGPMATVYLTDEFPRSRGNWTVYSEGGCLAQGHHPSVKRAKSIAAGIVAKIVRGQPFAGPTTNPLLAESGLSWGVRPATNHSPGDLHLSKGVGSPTYAFVRMDTRLEEFFGDWAVIGFGRHYGRGHADTIEAAKMAVEAKVAENFARGDR